VRGLLEMADDESPGVRKLMQKKEKKPELLIYFANCS